MQHTFSHKFTTSTGVLVHVPTKYGRERGDEIVDAILKRWRPPNHFYHFHPGGHVAACRLHLENPCFACLDIKSFFTSVTRTKVHRALRRIGFPQAEAVKMTFVSTVLREETRDKYCLPFGFTQSMVLASLALDRSLVGQRLRVAGQNGVRVSVYVDDIILSSREMAPLLQYVDGLVEAATASGFVFNPSKTSEPGPGAAAFNIDLTQRSMRITDVRMAVFKREMRGENLSRIDAMIAYVGTVDKEQAKHLNEYLDYVRAAAGDEKT